MAMAEAGGSGKSKTQKSLTANDDVVAAQRLSDEGNDTQKKKRERSTDEEDVDGTGTVTGSLSDATCAKIHEIFGNDEVFRPKKQRKYRSLASIYMSTTPVEETEKRNHGQDLKKNLL